MVILGSLSSGRVAAEPAVRQVGASSRVLGCTSWAAIPCDSTTQTRLGHTIVDLQWRRQRGLAPVAMFVAAGRTADAQLFSQVIVGGGLRLRRGRMFVQAGPGIAAWRYGPGPKTITTRQVMDRAVPALLGGVGLELGAGDDPLVVSLDAGAALTAYDHVRVQQLTASVTRRF